MSLRVNILLKYKLLINFSFDIYCMYEGQICHTLSLSQCLESLQIVLFEKSSYWY